MDSAAVSRDSDGTRDTRSRHFYTDQEGVKGGVHGICEVEELLIGQPELLIGQSDSEECGDGTSSFKS